MGLFTKSGTDATIKACLWDPPSQKQKKGKRVRVKKHEITAAACTTSSIIFVAFFLLFSLLLFNFYFIDSAQAATVTIYSSGSGCSAIGTWDAGTKTCTMTADYDAGTTNGIVISSNGITLDGNGFTLTGSGSNTSGVSMVIKNNVTIKNLTITGFHYGVYFLSSSNNTIYNNNFIANNFNAYGVGGSGNSFDLPGSGGNYWDDFDTSAEGCSDSNLDYICDAAYSFPGGVDNQPWNQVDGWLVPPPADSTPPVISNVQPSGYVTTASPTISADYTDPSGVDTATVVVSVDGTPLSGCTATATSGSCTASGLAEGAHSITVDASDNAGNAGSASGSFNVDSVAPAVSNVLPSGTTFNDSPIVSADYSDGGSGIDTTSVSVTLNGSPLSGCAVSATPPPAWRRAPIPSAVPYRTWPATAHPSAAASMWWRRTPLRRR
jgi:parallel beta-helix repeat protein